MSLPTVYYLQNSVMSCSVSLTNHKRKKRGAYKMPGKIPSGDILVDSSKKEWIIQSSIAKGGFGEIYSATSKDKPSSKDYVIKIEPCENGPLFCEKTVYIRIGKKEDIQGYLKTKNLKCIGMPAFLGSGTHTVSGKKFRFLVMERYGKDLWSIFLEKGRIFPPATCFKVAVQVLDVLEYIHSKGYVHADIKGANLLLGIKRGFENQVYLVDFGLAAKYTNQNKPDPRRAHNGTLEYTSRDGHEGIVTRRGDIEILGFNLLQWLSSNLPWEGLKDLHEVQSRKNKYMKDCRVLMRFCFKDENIPKALEKYFECLVLMEPLEEPDYDKLRLIMKEGIRRTGDTTPKLVFSPKKRNKTNLRLKETPKKIRKVNEARTGRSPTSEGDKTIEISESSNSSSSNEGDDFIQSTPEKKTTKRSWKDCPSVVACAELLLKEDKSLRRSKRKK